MMYYRSLHTCTKRETIHRAFVLMQRGGNAISIFIFRGVGMGWFFFCIPLYICQESKSTKTSGYLCNLPQLSGRYSQTKTAPVRFYFTLVRKAIITNTSVIIPFDVWWKKTKGNKLWHEHKEVWALCIANRNMKCLSLCKRLVFHHTQR